MPKRKQHLVGFLLVKQGGRCYEPTCQAPLDEDSENAFDVDHIVRVRDGGSDETDNKCLLCTVCHRRKTALENATLNSPTREQIVREMMRTMQTRRPQQTHQRYSVYQLRGWWNSRALRTAPKNRAPCWDERKRRAYVMNLLEGRITPPIFVNLLRKSDQTRHIYDGVNRMTSLMQFMDGKMHVHLQETSRATTRLSFGNCAVAGCMGRDCFAMTEAERESLHSHMIDVFEWDDLPESIACEIAQNINCGTPMNVGERVRLLCGSATPRAHALDTISRDPRFATLVSGDSQRDGMLKALAIVLRSLIDPGTVCTFKPHFEQLRNFYSNPKPLSADATDNMCAHVVQIVELLQCHPKTLHNFVLAHVALTHPGCDVASVLADSSDDPPEEKVRRWTRSDVRAT